MKIGSEVFPWDMPLDIRQNNLKQIVTLPKGLPNDPLPVSSFNVINSLVVCDL